MPHMFDLTSAESKNLNKILVREGKSNSLINNTVESTEGPIFNDFCFCICCWFRIFSHSVGHRVG